MKISHATLALPLLLILSLGCHPDMLPPELAQVEIPVVNGKTDNGHLAVGALISGGSSACTATLVGKHTVVTAAHCVCDGAAPCKLRTPVHLYLGGYPYGGTKYTAMKVIPHPSYKSGNKDDIAVVILSKDVTGITPQVISSTPPKAGETIVMVGYGLPGEKTGKFGTKRMATNKIDAVYSYTYYIKGSSGFYGNICNGDSGGPSFASRNGKDVFIGVHSTKTNYCGYAATDMRVDSYRSWITSKASGDVYTGSPADKEPPQVVMLSPKAGAEVKRSFTVSVLASDDIGITKVVAYVDAKVVGTLTAMPYDFALKNLSLGSHTIEVVAHDAHGRTSSAAIAVTVKDKITPPPTKKDFGESCSKHGDCKSNICMTSSATGAFCSKMCTAGQGSCPTGYECKNSVCQKKSTTPPPPKKKSYGEACNGPGDCQSGLCAPGSTQGVYFCTKICDPNKAGSCPLGTSCLSTGAKSVCMPTPTPTSGEEEGGCGAQVTPGSAPSFPGLLLLISVLFLAIRRQSA